MPKHKKELKTVKNLEPDDCRWPIGDPQQVGFHFCGAKRESDRPYCQHHWAMSFTPSKLGQRSRVPALRIKQAA